MSGYLVVIFAGLAAYTGWQMLRTARLIRVGRKIAAASVPFSRTIDQAPLQMLVVGDSSGLGIGASAPASSLAGSLGKRYERADVVNVAVTGALTRDAVSQLRATPGSFDLILVLVGGNDVVYFTSRNQLSKDIETALSVARQKGRYVLLSTTGNIGHVLLFPAPLRWIYSHRSRVMRLLFATQVAAAGDAVRFADPYREGAADPFFTDPKTYFAADLFHPSDAGYADWFRFISAELDHFRL